MPMILYTFFDTYDLSGKTVALFCTNGGSGLSGTVNEVKSLEPNAAVTAGLHWKQHRSFKNQLTNQQDPIIIK